MLAPWRSNLLHALHRNRSQPHARYFQLATVDSQGFPYNRTVVFRGFFSNEDNSLKIITDSRSEKSQQIEQNPRGEICWYFTKTREQFRIAGKIKIISAREFEPKLQQARQATWHNLSDAARVQFAWPDPGKPRTDKSEFDVATPTPTKPLNNFCLLLFIPHRVDFLELRGEPQNRYLYCLQPDNTWSIQSINP